MDWEWNDTHVKPNQRPRPLQVLEMLREHWRVVGPSGRVITCAVYRVDAPGLQLRAGYSAEEFLRAQRVADLTQAHVVAETWRASVLAKGFMELPIRSARNGRA
jgi:hypothetical protein